MSAAHRRRAGHGPGADPARLLVAGLSVARLLAARLPVARLLAARLLVGGLAVVLLAGCVPSDTATPAPPLPTPELPAPGLPAPTSPPAPSAVQPGAHEVRRDGSDLVSGAVTLRVLPRSGWTVGATALDDGSARLELTTPSGSPPAGGPVIAAPVGDVWDVLGDGSAVLRDTAGDFVAGLTPAGSRLVRQDDEVVVLVPRSETPSLWLATVAVEATDWGDREGGRSLAVTPSAWARAGGLAAQAAVREQLVAREPEADTPTMLGQLACHELGAPDKATWNLEPWRPDVGPLDMIAARCNP